MADGIPAHTVRLATARVRGAPDGLRARLRLEQALAGLEAPCGPEILFVRSLRPDAALPVEAPPIPTPTVVARRAGARFANAVQDALRAKAERARRPWLDDGATSADAVVFADEAELLACLLRDHRRGRLAGCWWTPAILRGRAPVDWVRSVLKRGDLLPAVVGALAAQGRAVDWVAGLPERDARDALAAVAAAHGLNLPVIRDASAPDAPPAASPGPSEPGPDVSRLRQAVPELARAALPSAHRSLLALTLALHRTGAWVRSDGFRAVWPALAMAGRAAGSEDDDGASAPAERRLGGGQPSDGDAPAVSHAAGVRAASGAVTPRRDAPAGAVEPAAGDPAAARPPAAGDAPSPGFSPTVPQAAARASRGPARTRPPASAKDGPAAPPGSPSVLLSQPPGPVAVQPEAAGEGPAPVAARVHTGYGGLFYLLNVALALDLYGDFSQPRRPGLDLSPWDWLALIGLAWFGGDFRRDPICGLLADLAGRLPGERPGRFFRPPGRWQVADAWLAPWALPSGPPGAGGEPPRVRVARRRLQVWHPAGFSILDVPRRHGQAPLAQARALCAAGPLPAPEQLRRLPRTAQLFRLPGPACPPLRMPGTPRRLHRWLGWLLPYLEARLARALDSEAGAGMRETVCRHEAVLACTPTRLDVFLSLDALPITLRCAGLDRDPGWIPAAGRSVAFHFRSQAIHMSDVT